MPGALIVRTWRGKPFTKDILAKGIRQVREKLGIPKELKLGDLRRTALDRDGRWRCYRARAGSECWMVYGHRCQEPGHT